MAQFLAGERVAVKAAAFVFAVALCLWGVFADAATVNVCSTEGASCGGADSYIDESGVDVEAVYSCREVDPAVGSDWTACTDGSSVIGLYRFVASLEAGDFVLFGTGWGPVEEAVFFDGGGEEEPAAEVNLLGIPDLTAVQWGGITNAFLGLFAVVACIGIIRKSL